MSPECQALSALTKPERPRAGDMWLSRRLGIVIVRTGHLRRRGRHGNVPTQFHLYHWAKPCLTAHPQDWRDYDPSSYAIDSERDEAEKWEYVGNMFEMLPYEMLATKGRP